MVDKEDKDGQIDLLRDALEKIQKTAIEGKSDEWIGTQTFDEIEHIARAALIDTTF